jgi:hypothetical protein
VAGPHTSKPIHLTEEIAASINCAAVRGRPVAVAYVDGAGRPHLSLRGTIQVYNDDQLTLWARSPGMPDALVTNPHVALLYQDLPNHTFYQFTGRATTVIDPETRDRIFDNSPAAEQAEDPDRAGAAIIIEIDSVRGRGSSGMVVLVRDDTCD